VLTRRDTFAAATKPLKTSRIRGRRAEALRLYVGADYKEISVHMNVSLERVRHQKAYEPCRRWKGDASPEARINRYDPSKSQAWTRNYLKSARRSMSRA
jgi:hypothetical protein